MIKVATHNGIFHADEVTAIALLKVFLDEDVEVTRLPHQAEDFSSFDMVIDIGLRFDGRRYFDHHQNKGGRSSAGLIWEYIGKEEEYPRLSEFIEMIDMHDTGLKKAGEFEYPNLVRCFNLPDIYCQEQDEAFDDAVAFAQRIVRSMKTVEEEIHKAKKIVARSKPFDANAAFVKLASFTPHWTQYLNGEKTPHIDVVVWEDESNGKYYAKVPPIRPGSFELASAPFEKDESMDFVHSAGFIAVAKDEETMKSYLKRRALRKS